MLLHPDDKAGHVSLDLHFRRSVDIAEAGSRQGIGPGLNSLDGETPLIISDSPEASVEADGGAGQRNVSGRVKDTAGDDIRRRRRRRPHGRRQCQQEGYGYPSQQGLILYATHCSGDAVTELGAVGGEFGLRGLVGHGHEAEELDVCQDIILDSASGIGRTADESG